MRQDEQLISLISNGDEAALEELYRAYYPRLARFVLRVANDRELVVEVINDTFYVVWTKSRSFRGESAVSTWIIGIAYRKALKALRERRRFESLDDDTQTTAGNVEQLLDISAGLKRLTPEHRAVVELTYYFGYSYKEIGEILGCPENTVKTRMFHARRNLRAMMEA